MNDYIAGELAFYQGNYSQAVTAFERLRSASSLSDGYFYYISDGQSAVHLAYAYIQLEQQTKAQSIIDGFSRFLEESKTKKSNDPSYYYNMALVSALNNDNTATYQYIQGAIDAGWIRVWQADLEPILAQVAQEQQFTQMMGGIRARLINMRAREEGESSFLLADSESF